MDKAQKTDSVKEHVYASECGPSQDKNEIYFKQL